MCIASSGKSTVFLKKIRSAINKKPCSNRKSNHCCFALSCSNRENQSNSETMQDAYSLRVTCIGCGTIVFKVLEENNKNCIRMRKKIFWVCHKDFLNDWWFFIGIRVCCLNWIFAGYIGLWVGIINGHVEFCLAPKEWYVSKKKFFKVTKHLVRLTYSWRNHSALLYHFHFKISCSELSRKTGQLFCVGFVRWLECN